MSEIRLRVAPEISFLIHETVREISSQERCPVPLGQVMEWLLAAYRMSSCSARARKEMLSQARKDLAAKQEADEREIEAALDTLEERDQDDARPTWVDPDPPECTRASQTPPPTAPPGDLNDVDQDADAERNLSPDAKSPPHDEAQECGPAAPWVAVAAREILCATDPGLRIVRPDAPGPPPGRAPDPLRVLAHTPDRFDAARALLWSCELSGERVAELSKA